MSQDLEQSPTLFLNRDIFCFCFSLFFSPRRLIRGRGHLPSCLSEVPLRTRPAQAGSGRPSPSPRPWPWGVHSTALTLPGKPCIKIQKTQRGSALQKPTGGCFCVTTCPSLVSRLQSRHTEGLSANYKLRDLVALGSLLLFQSHAFSLDRPSLE